VHGKTLPSPPSRAAGSCLTADHPVVRHRGMSAVGRRCRGVSPNARVGGGDQNSVGSRASSTGHASFSGCRTSQQAGSLAWAGHSRLRSDGVAVDAEGLGEMGNGHDDPAAETDALEVAAAGELVGWFGDQGGPMRPPGLRPEGCADGPDE
jgi:hypothetical protein